MEMERMIVEGGKTEGKITGPLFPRLHVDDTKKIGPKAPPRNKMALYEQQSIPSLRLSNTTTSTIPPPPLPVYGRMLTNMSSRSQGVTGQKSQALNHSNGRQTSRSNERRSDNTNGNSLKRSIITQSENVNNVESQLLTVPSTFFEPCKLSQFKWPYLENNEPELRVPSFVHPQMSLGSSNNQSSSNKEKILVSASCSLELQTTSAKKVKTFVPSDLVLDPKNGDSLEVPELRHSRDMKPLAKQDYFDVLDLKNVTSNWENRSCETDHTDTKTRGHKAMPKQVINQDCKGVTTEEPKVSILNNPSKLRSELSCQLESPITNIHHRTPNVGNGNDEHEENTKTDRSHTSEKDCAVISPDFLIEMIGKKHFSEARNEIIRQQRLFSMQLFELHRIIKVQKMFTSSGILQQKEFLSLGDALAQPNFMKDAPLWHGSSSDEVLKNKVVVDNPHEKPLLHLLSSNTSSLNTNLYNFSKPTFGNLPMWCVPPLGNQWLLPVMSPSEGLIYKPYPNPPPTVPFLGTEATRPTLRKEFHSPMDPSFLAPYGMSMVNSFGTASAIKPMTGLTSSFNNNYCEIYSGSSISNNTRNVGEAKDNEKLESTTNCPKKIKTSNDALPLFPTSPTTTPDFGHHVQSCSNERRTNVIKVIPRNPRLASESVASIIKLIQEERKTLL